MKSKLYILILIFLSCSNFSLSNETDIYKKIDYLAKFLKKINKEYVEEVNQGDVMDAAINGVYNH